MSFFDDPYFSPPEDGRVEAVAKVTGKGKYSAEFEAKNLCYAVMVGSSIPAGIITRLRLEETRAATGVIDILSHENKPPVPGFEDEAKIKDSKIGLPWLYTNKIRFKGQPIAVVIAETYEEAVYAASLVSAEYDKENFDIDFHAAAEKAPLTVTGKDRGSLEAWGSSPHLIEAAYTIAAEVHNPMEMHATIAEWTADDQLKLYDKNQGVNSVQETMSKVFGIPATNIHVTSEFVGGGFGSGLRVWSNGVAAVMAAKLVKRPVKLVLTRPQMFTLVGHRPESWQKIKLGADANGKFTGILHQAKHSTSAYETFNEGITRISRLIYNFPNLRAEAAVVPLNIGTPTWMRGPGDCTGDFAIESAIDELSYKIKADPVELRMKNIALDKDPENGKPWSSNFINECIEKGAAKIGWKNRPSNPGAQTEGNWKIGYGMALGMWNAGRQKASASIELQRDGSIIVKTAMTDIGTGTGISMLNIAHEATAIPKNKIKIELGNSDLPPAPRQGGSTGLSSISGAINEAAKSLKTKLAALAAAESEVYKTASPADVLLEDKGIAFKTAGNQPIAYATLFDKNKLEKLEAEASSGPGAERDKFAFCSAAAHFCIVKVNSKTGKVKVDKMVCVVDGGKIVSEKPAANQISGAAVGGIGMALMEEQQFDTRLGAVIGNDLAGYHFAVNADAPIIDVEFINKPDPNINPSGAKGLGEVGIIGVAAAIANAVYNATGMRFRDIPITPAKVLGSRG